MRLIFLLFIIVNIYPAWAGEIPASTLERLEVLTAKEAQLDSDPNHSIKALAKVRKTITTLRREFLLLRTAADFNKKYPRGVYTIAKSWAEFYLFRHLSGFDKQAAASAWAKGVAANFEVGEFEDFKSSFVKLYTFARSTEAGGYGWDHDSAVRWAMEKAQEMSPDAARQFAKDVRNRYWDLWKIENELRKQMSTFTCAKDLELES